MIKSGTENWIQQGAYSMGLWRVEKDWVLNQANDIILLTTYEKTDAWTFCYVLKQEGWHCSISLLETSFKSLSINLE